MCKITNPCSIKPLNNALSVCRYSRGGKILAPIDDLRRGLQRFIKFVRLDAAFVFLHRRRRRFYAARRSEARASQHFLPFSSLAAASTRLMKGPGILNKKYLLKGIWQKAREIANVFAGFSVSFLESDLTFVSTVNPDSRKDTIISAL
jgi:hypothetical protein